MTEFTLIVPFYRNVAMLTRQVEEWNQYPEGVTVICVDDGSPEPALPIITGSSHSKFIDVSNHDEGRSVLSWPQSIQLYRILVDKPWNRVGARNLGAHIATTEWILQADIDHILPADSARALLAFTPDPNRWYRFPRWRFGAADGTRRKDAIAPACEYGQVHPHVDSYLIRKAAYWETGGYDEDYAGCLGGGGAFLRRLESMYPVDLLPEPIRLEVYTRNAIADANDLTLSRDTTIGANIRRKKAAMGDDVPRNPLRFEWVREL
jgi:hypothetical protein